MRLSLVIGAGVAIAAVMSCRKDATSNNSPFPQAATVSLTASAFVSDRNGSSPAVDTIAPGGQVTWVWTTGALDHNIVALGPLTFTGTTDHDFPFQYSPTGAFDRTGVYNYLCTNHVGMTGTIVVQ